MHAGNRCRETLTKKPREAVVQHTQKMRRTKKIKRKALLIDSPSENSKDLEAHVPAHSSEREFSDSEGDASKVETQKRKHSIYTHFPETEIETYAREPK